MNRKEAAVLLPIIKAFSEGRVIQYQSNGKWRDYTSTELAFDMIPIDKNYRIKPEPKYRPFANAGECWNEMQKHQPFGWVKSKDTQSFLLCKTVGKFTSIGIENSPYTYDDAFEFYTFADDAPFGVKEE